MQLTLSPVFGFGEPETVLSVAGDVLTVDGTDYNLSSVPEGGEATPEGSDHPFVGTITRTAGAIACTVVVVLGPDASFDQPVEPHVWTISTTNGPVVLPVVRIARGEL